MKNIIYTNIHEQFWQIKDFFPFFKKKVFKLQKSFRRNRMGTNEINKAYNDVIFS